VSTVSHAYRRVAVDMAGVMARRPNMYRVSRFRDDAKTMRVRLVKKLADMIDDIDLSRARIGDILTLRFEQALLLVAEGWAVPHASRT
jgi:hypothetical protein